MITPHDNLQKVPGLDLNFIHEIARDLPIIRPIKEFIHLNLLLPYQHLNFWEALKEVSIKLDAMTFPDLSFFQEKMKSGELPQSLIEKKVAQFSEENRPAILALIRSSHFEFIHHDVRVGPLHDEWNRLLQINVIQLADGMLIKWLGMFMDQGISHWQMPGAEKLSFYDCLRLLLRESYVKPHPFTSDGLETLLPETAEDAIALHLDFLCPDKDRQRAYCAESILTLRGWAGMIFSLEKNPELLSFPRKITLIDFLAIKLTLERAWIQVENISGSKPDFSQCREDHPHPFENSNLFHAFKACQEAFEEHTYQKVLQDIVMLNRLNVAPADYQAVFCMDDRECGLRRNLEEQSPHIQTFGTAGHFGIECLYQHSSDPFPKKQCPAPMTAKYLLKEIEIDENSRRRGIGLRHHLIQPSSNILTDWILLFVDSLQSFLSLGVNLFFPLAFKDLRNVIEVENQSELMVARESLHPVEGSLQVGYSEVEMSQVVYQQLLLMGLVHHLSSMIFIIGHGSSSENNPYFSAYGCGACSGRPGSANARAFVNMANRPGVRALIEKTFDLKIPDSTTFVAGFHDTCRDVVELFDCVDLSPDHQQRLSTFKKYLSQSLYKNARERVQAFKLVQYKPVGKEAQKEALRRSHSLFETRPELGHTNVSFAIVGRRSMTQGLNLGRRSFLQSYDMTLDPEGKLLAQLLAAVIPVCSGINLDYFFSRVDNQRFGAGSKLPQNIVGNIGVSHGTESDLLFGLPFQMIDQHQPARLIVLVEQLPDVALNAIQGHALVSQIVSNNWIHYASFDPDTRTYFFYRDGKMVKREEVGRG